MPAPERETREPTEPSGHVLDYEIDDYITADTPEAMKALGDDTRTTILAMLLERSATTSQLASGLGKPKGTVGYHLKVLEKTGLIRVVRRRRVRAMTEKYYGRVGRTIVYGSMPDSQAPFFMLQQAMNEARAVDGARLPMFTIRRARISSSRAVEFARRVAELAEDFTKLPRSGDTVHGFVAGVYPTDLPFLPDDSPGDEGRV